MGFQHGQTIAPRRVDGFDQDKCACQRHEQTVISRATTQEGNVKLPRRQFLCLAAGAAALPVVSQIATTQTYVRIV
jgi:hypothetical protein